MDKKFNPYLRLGSQSISKVLMEVIVSLYLELLIKFEVNN